MSQRLKKIGNYTIEKLIGTGIARVYLATHPRHGRVALKVLPPTFNRKPKDEVRFRREASIMQRIQHPNILKMYEASTHVTPQNEVYYYMAIEYQSDGSVYELLRRNGGKLPEQQALRLGVQIADALAFAHANGIIHRDVKPSNILLRGEQAILCDFNVSLDLERQSTGGIGMLGTLAYMSPEQTLGNRRFVRRGSDIYSFGLVLYEMLSGYQPRNQSDLPHVVVVQMIQDQPLPPLRDVAPHVSPAVAAVVDRCLQPRRDQRFETMQHVRDELRRAAEQSGYRVPHPPNAHMSTRPAGVGMPWWLILSIAGAIMLVVLFLVLVMVVLMQGDTSNASLVLHARPGLTMQE